METFKERHARFLKALKAVEEWWLTRGTHQFHGAPACIFAVRQLIREEVLDPPVPEPEPELDERSKAMLRAAKEARAGMTPKQVDLVGKLIDAKLAEWAAQHSEYGNGMEYLATMRIEEELKASAKERDE